MPKQFMLIAPLLMALSPVHAMAQSKGIPVEVVATATEYIAPAPQGPSAKSERSYTDCSGRTSYLGDFANTNISCSTTSTSGTSGTTHLAQGVTNAMGGGILTGRPKIRHTVVMSDSALYMFSCTERWRWSKCPAFAIGSKYVLTLSNSGVSLQDSAEGRPLTLQYLSSVALPKPAPTPVPTPAQTPAALLGAKVHLTSTPGGAEIFIDGKFAGDTPSDLTISAGEHNVKFALGGKEWSRSLQITSGEISVHADLTAEK